MKVAVIVYHSNILSIYEQEWINNCKESILNQTFKNFDILELNYGNDDYRIFESSIFFCKSMKNHIYAMNDLLDKSFYEYNYDVVFNTNLDDVYYLNRFESQLKYIDFDLVSSDFDLLINSSIINKVVDRLNINLSLQDIYKLDVDYIVKNDLNIICHPVVMWTKSFWEKYGKYEDSIPIEDLLLWKKSILAGAKVKIIPDSLMLHRVHKKSVSYKK